MILMVAITVILAAVIGTFVLGLGDQVSETAPQANFSFDFANDVSDSDDDAQLVITHESGTSISADRLNVTIDGTGVAADDTDDYSFSSEFPDDVEAGSSATVVKGTTGDDVWEGESIRVVWTSESGSSSATLHSQTAPQ
ncbi:hypothetical protein C441_16234 [Haloferax sulfurifontis ATCC BAA-897]|uniref:Archaeal Type IV pilin N-terminal domain-containing protein n=1 Tax=Haloferax sulfurifontis ATCC BAA-897 TaxID=662480 RepID=M0HWU5_9EURY|nr:hypothetical protein C441_16234 [Haloferax sulfurifontis ATCC BAA-897]